MPSSLVRLPRRGIFPFAALLALGAAGTSAGPISFDGTTTYTQDFQSMTTGTNTVAIAGSTMTEISTLAGGGVGVAGWYFYGQLWTTASTAKWVAGDTGSGTGGGFRELIDTQPTVGRAFGSLASGSAAGFFGLVLQNSSSQTINNLSIAYDAVMNRNPNGTTGVVNTFALGYAVSSTAVVTATQAAAGTEGTFGATLNSTTLGFSTPSSGTGAPSSSTAFTTYNPLLKIGNTITGTLSSLGWGAGQYLYIAWNDLNELGSDAAAGVDNFSISVPAGVRDLTWGLIIDGTWNSSTANFTSGGSATAFAATDNVTFDNAAGGIITLSGSLAPTSVKVSAASGTYTFNGPTAADKITGGTSIAKSGAGTLVLTSANDFTGGLTITGGTVQIDGAGRLGTGPISLNGIGASLVSTSSSALSMSANVLSVGANGGAINTGANSLTLGALTTSGMLTKTGAGSLTVGMVTSSAGAGFTVSAGDLVLGQASGVVKVFANTTLTGNLVLNSGIRFDVDGGSTVSGSGKIKVAATGALISNSSGDIGGTISTEIALNSNAIAFTKGTWAGSAYTPSTSFLTTVGGTTGGALSIYFLSGDSDIDLSNNSTGGGGAGTLTLTGASTYTGNTSISANSPASPAVSSVILGVDNALPIGTGLIVGTKTGVGVPVMDLNGKNQQFAYVADGANVTAAKYLKFVNNAKQDGVTVEANGNVIATAVVDGSGNWSATPTTALPEASLEMAPGWQTFMHSPPAMHWSA